MITWSWCSQTKIRFGQTYGVGDSIAVDVVCLNEQIFIPCGRSNERANKKTTTNMVKLTNRSKLMRLRAFAFCHGLAFHGLLLSVYIKTRLLGDSHEALSLVYGLQALALLATESFSVVLSEQIGCWAVLRLCGWVRLGALACLGIAVGTAMDSNDGASCISLLLLVAWSFGEGIARALYSGVDVDLVYRLSPDTPTTHHNLAMHHAMWPLAMVIACLTTHVVGSEKAHAFMWHVSASCVSIALSLYLIWCVKMGDGAKPAMKAVSPRTWTVMRALRPDRVVHRNWRTLCDIWDCTHMRRAWTYALVFALLTETLNKLRPLWLPMRTSTLTMCLTFLGSSMGSLASRISWMRSQRGAHLSLVVYACAPLLWTISISWNFDALIYFTCLLVSVAFGVHKNHFYAHLFAWPSTVAPPSLTKPALLSALNLSTQVVHTCWMCIFVSPLLDWRPCLLSPLLCTTSFILVVTLALLQRVWHRARK
jgi:hypothetical protein